jgi:dihydrofolate synthase / folylpolyglutamate synthase
MNYPETLEYLFSQLPMFHRIGKAAYKANLDNTLVLDEYFGHPHQKYKTIHIAGTNGKGSVSHILASVLQQAGYKTGLYTSPHLKDFRERIKINGKEIPENQVIEFIEKHKSFYETIEPSFFELTVAMAFDYFAKSKVDVAVIETGLGGRLDSTNIIIPELSVITNISNDHGQLLGDTLEKIAREKAGIIKKNVSVVIGESQKATNHVFINKAKEMESPIYFASHIYHVNNEIKRDEHAQTFQVFKDNQLLFPDLKIDLLGIYQKKNILAALQAIEVLQQRKFKIKQNHIYQGFYTAAKSTGLLGRWQTIGQNPLTICDTGHNEAGIAEFLEQIKLINYNQLHIIFGIVEDKDIDKILEMLPIKAHYYFCRASIPRALDEKILKQKASLFGLEGKSYPTVQLALEIARQKAQEDDFIYIGGSNFVVAEAIL